MEWYDVVFRLADRNTPAVRTISAYISTGEFKKKLEIPGGYYFGHTGGYEEF
jgi:hypothetical protein